jgi:hypothetical protein
MPLDHGKERCKAKVKAKAKAKAKANKKQSGLLFLWLRCVLLGWPIFLYPSMAIFLFFTSGQAADPDRSQRMLCPGPDWW